MRRRGASQEAAKQTGEVGHGEAGREPGEGSALRFAVLDDGDGEAGVHGGQRLAGGGDDHDLVDGRGEGVAHPLEERSPTEVGRGLVGAETPAQTARHDDAGYCIAHGLRVREQGSL